MILTDDTHEYACTRCTHTGQPCMEGLWLVRRLAQVLAARTEAAARGYDLSCSARFAGCGRDCRAAVRARAGEVAILCGIDAGPGAGEPASDAAALAAATVVARPIAGARAVAAVAAG